MPKIVVEPARCRRCGACAHECPAEVFTLPKDGAAPRAERPERCIACGHCVALCTREAIRHADFPPGSVRRIDRDLLPGPDALMELFRVRRSARVFLDRPVPRELLEKVIEAGRLAPTAHNDQGTGYIVVQDAAELRHIAEKTAAFLGETARQLRSPVKRFIATFLMRRKIKSALMMLDSFEAVAAAAREGGDKVLRGAPCVLLFHADPGLAYPDKSAQLAVQNASLMCEALGLTCFYTGYVVGACDSGLKFKVLENMPKGHRVYAGLAIGWPKYTFQQWPDRKTAAVQWR